MWPEDDIWDHIEAWATALAVVACIVGIGVCVYLLEIG